MNHARCSLARLLPSRNSAGNIPCPSSSTTQPPFGKSTLIETVLAPASNEFFRSSKTTPLRCDMAIEDVNWAMASGGKGWMDGVPEFMADNHYVWL